MPASKIHLVQKYVGVWRARRDRKLDRLGGKGFAAAQGRGVPSLCSTWPPTCSTCMSQARDELTRNAVPNATTLEAEFLDDFPFD